MRKMIVEVEVSVDGAMDGENMEFFKQGFRFHSMDVQEYLNDRASLLSIINLNNLYGDSRTVRRLKEWSG